MSFDAIQAYLRSALSPLGDEDKRRIHAWIESLETSDDSDHLGACIAIDIRSGALPASTYIEILSRLKEGYESPRIAFLEALLKSPDSYKLASKYAQDLSGEETQYVNVLDLDTFLQFYVFPSYQSLNVDDREEAKQIFFGVGGSNTLEQISQPWSGPSGIVWISSLEDLALLVAGHSTEEQATILHDVLGLGDFTLSELVYVVYPAKALLNQCAQPTSLDAGWKNPGSCYVSNGDRMHWGKTHSRSGSQPGCRERVHSPIPQLTREYSVYLLGKPHIRARNLVALRQEAERRFNDCSEGLLDN